MSGLPMEIITFFASTILGGVLKLWSMKIQAKTASADNLIRTIQAQAGIVQEAREYKGSEEFEWTKRTIALAAVGSIIVLPKLAAFLAPIYEWVVPISYGWTEVEGGFWPWSADETRFVWKTTFGMAITPLDTHLVSSIAGLYFGGSLANSNRRI